MNSSMARKDPDEPFVERVDRLYRELERAVHADRPSILLAIYRSERIRREAAAALSSRLQKLGQEVLEYVVTGPKNADIPVALLRERSVDNLVYYVSGLRWGGGKDGWDAYRSLNIRREYFVEHRWRVVFWLTESEARNLPRQAPDFWSFRHRVVEFLDAPTAKHIAHDLAVEVDDENIQGGIQLREELLRELPPGDESMGARADLLGTLASLYARKRDDQHAAELFQQTINLAQDLEDTQLEARSLQGLGMLTYRQGHYGEALENFQRAIELDPDQGESYIALRRIEEIQAQETRALGPTPHNLPFPSLGALFKGRDHELAEIGEGGAAAITAMQHTILGLGGIGKTRLAVEFAWRNLARYCAVLFVVAESPERLRAELTSLAGPRVLALLDGEQMGAKQEQILDVVLLWLRTHLGWLLIFDHVDNPETAVVVEELLPQLTGGHVLITSRLSTWGAGIHRMALDTLPPEEARAFLLARLGRSGEENEALASELAEVLGRLPLALEQAAAYMDRRRSSFARYLTEWRERRGKVLAWHDHQLMKYPASVATTWETTFKLLSPTARTVLRLAAHLAPEPITIAMFEEGAEIVAEACAALAEEPAAEIDPMDALAELGDYSMITLEEETFTTHRLVQEVTRSRIAEGQREAWVVWALRLVHGYAPEDPFDVRTWPVWDPLRPHAVRVLEHGGKVGDPQPASVLMNSLALLLEAKALYSEAEPLYRRALEIDEESYGPQHPRVAIALNNLAQLLQATNRLAEAEPLMRRALEVLMASLGPEHPSTQAAQRHLDEILYELP